MRKEVSLAVIIGIILGAIILYGINLANQSTKNLPQNTKTTTTPSPTLTKEGSTDTNKNGNKISVTSHVNNQVVFENKITLVGKANANSTVAVVSSLTEEIIQSNATGAFSITIDLEQGENIIELSQLNQNQDLLDHTTISIVYSSKVIE